MKKNFSLFNKGFILSIGLLLFPIFASAKLSPGEVGGKSYILLESNSNVVLSQYRADEQLAPASITKLMTAYVVYQSISKGIISLSDKTIISTHARSMGGSRMFLEQGSHVSIDNLLSGLVIQSGNDAAIALAEAVAGDEARFVELMNKHAKQLGLTHSQFKNATGLPEQGHYMSARDIAKLSQAIIQKFPKHYQRYSKKTFTWNNITQDNRNALLQSNPNVDGLKTGHTDSAGYCLAASAKRGNMRLISVVLGTDSSRNRVRASKKILAYGFEHFLNQTLYQPQQPIALAKVNYGNIEQVGVTVPKAVVLPLPKTNATKGLTAKLVLSQTLKAPLAKGQRIGKINIQKDDQLLVSVPAVTATEVKEIGYFKRFWRDIRAKVSSWF